MDINKALRMITDKVDAVLLKKNFQKQNVAANKNEITTLYTGDVAYSIVYYTDKMRVVLRLCGMEDNEPDNAWKTIATWLFDPEVDTEKEAENIGRDFAETITGPKQIAAQKKKKKRKDGENNTDPLFLANRMVSYFPAIREDIAYEKAHYESFRGTTFAEEKIVPYFKEYVATANKNALTKMSKNFSTLYNNGDLDVKGIITYILFNAIDDDAKFEQLISEFEKDQAKIAREARKLRGKKLKPEKPKKPKKYIADNLNSAR